MPYSADLDECLFTKALETEMGRLSVSIYSYNKGPKKLQLTRENRDSEGGFKFTKLGRMSKEEIESVLPIIKEAIAHMA